MNGIDLLNAFREQRSEQAFSELVQRYTNLVYSVAKRRLGNQTLAQDVCQTVFMRLASRPPVLSQEAELAAWLHRTTLHVSIDHWRSESRRRSREEHAVAMHTNPANEPSWNDIAPALDEALNDLNDTDRQAILLRFFNHKSMRELGDVLGISEDAAKMRVTRALDRLRNQLGARGVTCSAVALAALLAERSLEAVPAEIAAAIASAAYPIGEGAVGAAMGSAGVTAGLPMAKLAVGVMALAIVGGSAWYLTYRNRLSQSGPLSSVISAMSTTSQAPNTPKAPATLNAPAPMGTNAPAPFQLLHAVARARQRIVSGSLEFQVNTFGAKFHSTNHLRGAVVFDGFKRRFDQVGREYSYTYDSDPARQQDIATKADAYGFDKEGAMRAGLLHGFESHHVTTYDGSTLMTYWENDGKPQSTQLDDPSKGGLSYAFDPHCLGLESASYYPLATVEQCLRLDMASSAQLLGTEAVDGLDAWHVRVPGAAALDIWVDAAHPTRVLKVQAGSMVILSRYEPGRSANPFPKEVVQTYYVDGAVESEARFVRTAAQLNINVEPATFTLAGLGMKVGTDVIDVRIHRRIGYWTGAGLSEYLPRSTPVADQDKPTLEQMLEILDNVDPASPAAFDAAQWILLNTPDGPAVEKAAGIILREHVRSPDLLSICGEMDRMRHRCAVELLEAALKENPHESVRAMACFTLATLAKDQSKHGQDKPMAARADAFFDRVIKEFSKAGPVGADLSRKAKTELSELRRMSLGQPAPDFDGIGLDGRPVRLRDYRGKVVIVTFWTDTSCDRVEEHFRQLEQIAGKPIAWIGVYCDEDLSQPMARLEKYQTPWPIIQDGRQGPIATDWLVHGWPSVYILDRTGVIRSRDDREKPLSVLVASLLGE